MRSGQRITDELAGYITRVEELAYELRISEVMTRDVKTVTPDMQMVQVLELFRKARISGAPVVVEGRLVGIISIEDLIRCLRGGDVAAPASDYMSTQVITVKAFHPVVEALKLFAQTRVGRLPVVDESGALVGIITKGDITRGLLRALQSDYQEEEVRRYRASHLFEDIVSDRTSLILRYTIKPRDFAHGGAASSHIKRALLRLGANPQIARRCGIAAYEAEMNLIIHTTNGGVIQVEIEPHLITMRAVDDGPGIEDIELAMRPGYSTAPEEIRELGFGAGMGLTNIQRCVDQMVLESTPGKGTRLEMKIFLQHEEALKDCHYNQEKKT
ncbi:MAG: CBS domain-containing protein [Anaerolineae bacterium]|nr:CBS domain-containing protein [Anaerolineae bacterium]MDW8099890.1 CBS domain-containing protein [Anaerolineae bacterium]